MNIFLLIPISIGLSVVLQGILNRNIGNAIGLPTAVLINGTGFFVLCVILYYMARWMPEKLPTSIAGSANSDNPMKLWYWIPGVCGFVIVLGIPVALQLIGPTKTFITSIVTQVVFSLIMEKILTEETPSTLKIAGAVVATIGAVLVSMS